MSGVEETNPDVFTFPDRRVQVLRTKARQRYTGYKVSCEIMNDKGRKILALTLI